MQTKPDFDRAATTWDHYWNHDVLERPLVVAGVSKRGRARVALDRSYLNALTGRHAEQLALTEWWLESTDFLAEAIPYARADFGPDQFAAFLGADLRFSEDSAETNWAQPIIEDWRDFLPLRLDPGNRIWRGLLAGPACPGRQCGQRQEQGRDAASCSHAHRISK